ncbi:MAG: hypothetical protein AAF805_15445, partial [Planctomycetota bacterium]
AAAEGVAIDDEAVQVISVRAAGSMRDSQSLLEQLLSVAEARVTVDDVNRLLGVAPAARVAGLADRLADRDAAAGLAELEAAIAGGADPGQVLDQLMGYYRDVMALTVGCDARQLRYALPAQADEARALGERLGVNTLLAAMQVLDQTAARMRVSVHERTLADMAVVRLAALEDLDDLAQAVADVRAHGADAPAPRPAARGNATAPAKKNGEVNGVATASDVSALRSPAPPAPTPPPPPEPEPAPPAAVAQPTPTALLPTTRSSPARANGAASPTAPSPPAPEPRTVTESSGGHKPGPAAEPATADADPTSLVAELAAYQKSGGGKVAKPATVPRRVSRRQQQAEAAEHPFIKKAMEVFGVETDKLRYTSPRDGQ